MIAAGGGDEQQCRHLGVITDSRAHPHGCKDGLVRS